MTVDPKTLLKSLTRNATVALEHAVAAAIAAKQVEVTVEHVLLDLLDDPGSDVALVLAHHAVDAERVRASLARSLDELRSGSDRRPTLSAGLLAWMQDAWQATCSDGGDGADGGYAKLRSGALLARVVVDPGKYLASAGESPLRSISKADMQVGLAARLAPMPEEAEARGGPATALLERTQRAAPRPTSAPAAAATPAARVVAKAPEAAPPLASKDLLKLLTRVAMRALEAAATRSKGAGHHEVTVEHVVLELLDDPGGDAALLIARYAIDEAKLRRALERSVDELRSGADRPPVISKAVFAWMQDAWQAASGAGYAKLRSGALLARLVVNPAKYFAHDGEAPLAAIGKEAMTTGLAEQLASMPEEAEARGGEASPLLERTQRAAPRSVSAARDEEPPARTPSRAPSPTAAPAETSRDLLKRLTRVAMRAFEAAASSSTSAGHHEITVEHVALELLDDPGGDVALLLAAHAIDPAPLRKALEASLDELRSGADRRPTMSPTVVAWMGDAWHAAGAPLGYTKLRSGALFARLIVQPAKYFADAARMPPLAIAKGGVTDGLAEQLAAMPEEAEARGGEARPLADRTRRGVAVPASPPPAPAAARVASAGAPPAEDAPAGSPIAAPTLSSDVLRHLTGVGARALEAATARSTAEGHHEVIVEHVLLALLADADADAGRLVAAYPVDARKLKKTLENNLDELRMGAEQPPVVADVVLAWMQDAWSATEATFGKLRSGALVARLVVQPSKYFGNATDDPLQAIPKDDMQAGLAARLSGWPEDGDAGAVAPRPVEAPIAKPEAAPAPEPTVEPRVEAAAPVDPMTRLSAVCARAFEAAAARAARMQHHEITVEHVVLALVDDDESDVAAILRARGLDADKLRGVLYRTLDKLAYGGSARATHAARLIAWVQDAASGDGARRLRSADLFAAVAAAPTTYTTNGIGAPMEEDAAALREIAAASGEAADA